MTCRLLPLVSQALITLRVGSGEMQKSEITIRIDLGDANTTESVWTTDLSYDYVKINAEYRT